MTDSERNGAQQPNRFNPARAGRLDDPARLSYKPPRELFALPCIAPGVRVILRPDAAALVGDWDVDVERPHDLAREHVDDVAQASERLLAHGLHVRNTATKP